MISLKEKNRLKKMVMASVMAALCCVATMVIHVPTPTGGYVNLGDTIVLFGAYILGPWWGGAAAGIGSGFADLLSGYPIYVPATIIIKALMAIVAGVLYKSVHKKGFIIVSGIVAEIIMIVGYWLYDGFLMKNLVAAMAGIPGNLVQAVFGIVASAILVKCFKKVKI